MFCGQKLDDLFAYETLKIVRIRDRRLGFVYYGLVLLVLCYVVGFQIFYANEHFKKLDVKGTARVTIQQPTRFCNPNDVDCLSNFHSLRDLPYCENYDGPSKEVRPEFKQKCTFKDQHSLAPTGMLENRILVPTRIDEYVEKQGCQPTAANEYTCDNEYLADPEAAIIYVADIERYTLLFAHAFHRKNVKGNNGQIQGYYWECETDGTDAQMEALKDEFAGPRNCHGTKVKKKIGCINDKCGFVDKDKGSLIELSETEEGEASRQSLRASRRGRMVHHNDLSSGHGSQGHVAAHDVSNSNVSRPDVSKWTPPDAFAIPDGDIFKLSKLLELAGVSLDGTFNREGEPLRESGTVIEVEAIYENLVPFASSFGFGEVSYTYKVSQRPMEEMKTEMLAVHQPNFPKERVIENRHGVYVIVSVSGQFGFFSFVYTIIMLTTAVGLLGITVVITDKIALYGMEHKEHYSEFKYQDASVMKDS